jgi:hypothetical protein
MWNYDDIKIEAKRRGIPVTDLIALSPSNDPMYAGKPADRQLAEWFSELWNKFGYGHGVHIRRVHYQIISQDPPVKMPNGEPYENTERCWDILSQASKQARYLGYVDAAAFDDRRNPEAIINATLEPEQPYIGLYDNLWQTPRLPDFPTLPQLEVFNYQPQQRYMIEIWAEKSTMNDVLKPLCEEYGANLQTGLGELSITASLNAVSRIARSGRPTRIFYVSDFDPAGQSMPVAVSRKIEYFTRKAEGYLDIRLYPIVLTADQVEQYNLPRTPIKDTEKRAGKFEERFGTGAVELDALEALHPGTLAEILRQQIDEYYDYDLDDRVDEAKRELSERLEAIRQQVAAPHDEQLARLRSQYEDIRQRFQAEIATYSQEQTALWRLLAQQLHQQAPDITDYPIPEAEENDQEWYTDPLYNSDRDYFEQLGAYKGFQGKVVDLTEV